jgi:hypothetical protein
LRTFGKRESDKHDWWYWEAASEDAHSNRASAGWLLWRSNLYGAYIPAYQTCFGTDPYDESSAGANASQIAFRPQMLTYPAKDGVIDTVQWEAVREGINDARYLTTMYAAARECKDIHIQPDLVNSALAYATSFEQGPLLLLSEQDYDNARAKIADYAVKLRAALDAYYKARGLPPIQ